jgi:hypothetical protein
VKQPIGMHQALRSVPLRPIQMAAGSSETAVSADAEAGGASGAGSGPTWPAAVSGPRGVGGASLAGRLVAAFLGWVCNQASSASTASAVSRAAAGRDLAGDAAHAAAFIPGRRAWRGARWAWIRRIAPVRGAGASREQLKTAPAKPGRLTFVRPYWRAAI